MATVPDLVGELLGMKQMMSSREAAGGKEASTLMSKYANSVASKVARLSGLTPPEASRLHEAVKSSGIPPALTSIIVTAIDSKFEALLEAAPEVKATVKQQLLLNAPAYANGSLLKVLQGPSTIEVKLQAVALYLANTLGCTHPQEKTAGAWTALVLLCHFQKWPKYKTVNGYFTRLKSDIRDCRKPWPLPKLAVYPKSPHELPDAMYQHIFGDEPPAGFSLERFEVAARCHVPLRKNSKLIRNEELKKGPKYVERDDTDHEDVSASPAESDIPQWAQALLKGKTSQALNSKMAPATSSEDVMPSWAKNLFLSQHQQQEQPPAVNATAVPLSLPNSLKPKLTLRSHAAATELEADAGTESAHTAPTAVAEADDAHTTDKTDPPRKTVAEIEADFAKKYATAVAKAKSRKRPAAADAADGLLARPAAADGGAKKFRPGDKEILVWSKKGKPPMLKTDKECLDYKTARIYLSFAKRSWRVIKERGNYATESTVSWKGDKPSSSSWTKAIDTIDSYVKTK